MRQLLLVLGILFLFTPPVLSGIIEEEFDLILSQTPPDETVSALVYLLDQVDTASLTRDLDAGRATLSTRHETIVRALQERARTTQGEVLADIQARARAGTIAAFEPYWITNVIRIDATPDAIRQIAARPDVDFVYQNFEITPVEPVAMTPADGGSRTPEIGVQAVHAPEVWAMGFTGEGMLVATLDTGVDGTHPALASRWRGLDSRYAGHPEWAFLDLRSTQWTTPHDSGSHGTHTMGTVCGGTPGNQVGVAPGAQWINAAVIDRVDIPTTVADAIAAFQWLVDPDGNPSTSWDVPTSCSNSWGVTTGHGYAPCDPTFWSYLDNCEAAGIVIVFSAGNEGSGASTLRRPADRATDDYRTCAIAAVDGNNPSWPIAWFSSRGPTNCTPSGASAIKPELSAPGVQVVSSVPGGGYAALDGTSMASPHVNGVIALLRQANPDLSVQEVKQILYETAYDLGSAGKDDSYGYGMVDAFAAVQMALSTISLSFSFPQGRPEVFDPLGGTTIRVAVSGTAVTPQPGTGMLYYSTGGAYTAVAMTPVSPNVYDAVFPAFDCLANVTYYFSAETTSGETITNPFGAPANNYHATVYTGVITIFEDNFESALGWTVYNSSGLTSGQWERGIPAGTGDRADPPTDADGSGKCYVTGNAYGDYDIDGGYTILTSPTMDASDPQGHISYYRWYHNMFGADPGNDIFYIEVSDNDGSTWHTLENVGPTGGEVSGGWFHKDFLISAIPGITNTDQFRIRFNAGDLNSPSVVEAGVDDVKISYLYCESPPAFQPGDLNCDGAINAFDIDPFVLALTSPTGYAAQYPDCDAMLGDINGDGTVNAFDIDPFVQLLTGK